MANEPCSPRLTYEVNLPDKGRRMRELIVYISDKLSDDHTYGATKLNKVLWWADFLSYRERGQPITGERYQRLPKGPCPVRLLPVRRSMIDDKDIAMRQQRLGLNTQDRVISLRNADLSIFDGEDIAIVDAVIESLRGKNADEVSAESHLRAWRTRGDKDLIPYEASLLSDEGITVEDVARTEALAKELGWNVRRGAVA